MNRILDPFEKPKFEAGTKWRDVFETYDKNFEKLYEFLVTLGTNYNVESFDNPGRTITLEHTFVPGNNQLLVFLDGAIQWRNDDYSETSNRTITFKEVPSPKSQIKVVVIESFSTMITSGEALMELVNTMNNMKELDSQIDNKFNELHGVEALIDSKLKLIDEKVSYVEGLVESLEGTPEGN